MSLINQMLKDLEKRRSRDLETSESLSRNITWETRPDSKKTDWRNIAVVTALLMLTLMVAYLLLERSDIKNPFFTHAIDKKTQDVKSRTIKPKPVKTASAQSSQISAVKPATNNENKAEVAKEPSVEKSYTQAIETENAVDADALENDKPVSLEKTQRPLNANQLAEVAYNKGYHFLQQGQMRQGKENLREALLLDKRHLKAREMLAGIYIKSGRYVEAAELLDEGVKIAPEYPLYAKLYARVLLEQNNPLQAIEVLERGLTTSNVAPDYYALLAATYQRVKNHEKAIDIYLRLVKLQPTAGVYWLGLAISLEKSGKNHEALDAYQRAQETGSLNSGLARFTDNRVSALKEIGFPGN
jgi:MSHA biogenesis protein MshN